MGFSLSETASLLIFESSFVGSTASLLGENESQELMRISLSKWQRKRSLLKHLVLRIRGKNALQCSVAAGATVHIKCQCCLFLTLSVRKYINYHHTYLWKLFFLLIFLLSYTETKYWVCSACKDKLFLRKCQKVLDIGVVATPCRRLKDQTHHSLPLRHFSPLKTS